MSKKERNSKIDKFIKSAFKLIREEISILVAGSSDSASAGGESVENPQLMALSSYEEKVVSEFRTLQIEKSPTPDSVQRIYRAAALEATRARDGLPDGTKARELIESNFEQVTNFCTNVLTKEDGVKFFDTKVFDIDAVRKINGDIQESRDAFTASKSSGPSLP
jgi:hypothetical protein